METSEMKKENKLKAIKKELKARQNKALKDRDFDGYEKAKSESVIFEKIINENIDLAFKTLFKN